MTTIPDANSYGRSEWISLIYNDQRSEAARWFGDRGWTADRISMIEYLRAHGRPEPAVGPSAGVMSPLVNLVTCRGRAHRERAAIHRSDEQISRRASAR